MGDFPAGDFSCAPSRNSGENMIIPITSSLSGEQKVLGTARVEPEGNDFSVEFYLKPNITITDEVRTSLEKELKVIARRQRDDSLKNLSIYEE
jgi:hypothetical protein